MTSEDMAKAIAEHDRQIAQIRELLASLAERLDALLAFEELQQMRRANDAGAAN